MHTLAIHSALRISIGEMHPLEGQSLSKLQEELRHNHYILIDEMSFIGPKMLTQIDAHLRQYLHTYVNISPCNLQSPLVVVP